MSTTHEFRRRDLAHHLHPFTNYAEFQQEEVPRVITRAEGVWLEDSDGQRILDGMAGLWCVNVGYGRKELAEAAYQQLLELPYYNTFFKTSHPPVIELAERLNAVTPAQYSRVFFTNSGSESNDTIIRMVRRYWDVLEQPQRKHIISRWNGYHGSTVGGASLGGMKGMHAVGGLPIPGISHIQQPYWYEHGGDLSPDEFGLKAAGWLRDEIERIGPDKVAAFIGEPIQGAGGVIVPPDSYWPEIQRICREYDILLIADEVICGFGRTGHWFGQQTFGFEADLMPIAKGLSSGYLPIGAVVISDRVGDVLIADNNEFTHGFTYSGHPAACAVANANIAILQREGLVERVRDDIGPYFQSKLAELADNPLVGEVRGRGLMAAIELVKDKNKRQFFEKRGPVGTICRDHSLSNNLVMRAVGDTMILSPPLIISTDEVDELIRRARKTLDLTANDVLN